MLMVFLKIEVNSLGKFYPRPFFYLFGPFWPKIKILAHIFQSVNWILMGIETSLMVLFWKIIEVCSPGKVRARSFCALFGPNFPLFSPKSMLYPISSKRFIKLCWFFSTETIFIVLEILGLQSRKNLIPPILDPLVKIWTSLGATFI